MEGSSTEGAGLQWTICYVHALVRPYNLQPTRDFRERVPKMLTRFRVEVCHTVFLCAASYYVSAPNVVMSSFVTSSIFSHSTGSGQREDQPGWARLSLLEHPQHEHLLAQTGSLRPPSDHLSTRDSQQTRRLLGGRLLPEGRNDGSRRGLCLVRPHHNCQRLPAMRRLYPSEREREAEPGGGGGEKERERECQTAEREREGEGAERERTG